MLMNSPAKLLNYCSTIFTKRENLRLVFLSLLSFFSALMEILTIGGLVPFINIFVQGEAGLNGRFLKVLYSLSAFFGSMNIVMFIGFFLIVISLLKIALNLFLVYSQAHLATSIQSRLSAVLLRNYALNNYLFHVNTNSSVLVKNITVETTNIYFFVGSLIKLIMNVVMAFAMLVFLLYINYKITLGIAVFFTVVMIFSVKVVSGRAKRLGYEREEIVKSTHKLAYQVLRGIKEIKISKVEDYFIERFSVVVNRLVPVGASFVTLSSSPKFLLEIVVYAGGIGMLMLVSHFWGADKAFLGLFVAFLAAIYKLAPAFSAISTAAIEIRYAIPSLEIMSSAIREALKRPEASTLKKIAGAESVRLVGTGLSYGGSEILKDVNLDILKGEKIAVIGKTGSGKSTLNNLLTGLLTPTAGKVLLNGIDLAEADPYSLARIIGYLPQDVTILDDTIIANITFGLPVAPEDRARIPEILKIVHLERFVDTLDHRTGEDGAMLSGGERQRLAIARLLYKNPEIVVLDEITSALDFKTEKAIVDDILRIFADKTVVMVTHSMRLIEKFDRVYSIENKTLHLVDKKDHAG